MWFLYDIDKKKDCCSTLLLCEIYPFRHRDTYRFGFPLCATKEKACRPICLSFCFKLPKLAIAYRKCYYIDYMEYKTHTECRAYVHEELL
jgi:hypothetical protein